MTNPLLPVKSVSAHPLRFIPEGQQLGWIQGWQWLLSGFWLFKQSWLSWVVMMVMYFAVMLFVNIVPMLGMLLFLLIHPILMGGFMLACRDNEQGYPVQVMHLFAGLERHTIPLLQLGLLNLAGIIAAGIMIAVLAIMFGATHSLFVVMSVDGLNTITNLGQSVLLILGLMFFLLLPLILAFFYAPALVVFHDFSPWLAVRTSFMACVRNNIPLLLYGLAYMGFAILGSSLLFVGLLVVVPSLLISTYMSYKAVFWGE